MKRQQITMGNFFWRETTMGIGEEEAKIIRLECRQVGTALTAAVVSSRPTCKWTMHTMTGSNVKSIPKKKSNAGTAKKKETMEKPLTGFAR
jgi:hypothetical protein